MKKNLIERIERELENIRQSQNVIDRILAESKKVKPVKTTTKKRVEKTIESFTKKFITN